MIDELRASGEWKIYLKIKISFLSSKVNNDKQLTYSKSDNIEIMIGNETDKTINELFDSLFTQYKTKLQVLEMENQLVVKKYAKDKVNENRNLLTEFCKFHNLYHYKYHH